MRKKQGISLIVLVITIVVMTILAATIMISLDDSKIIKKANNAVDQSDEKTIEQLLNVAWSEAYLSGKRTQSEFQIAINEKISENGINASEYYIDVTTRGVDVVSKKNALGYIVKSAADYGKTINYEANGVTGWKVFYHTDDYVYLIASERIPASAMPASISGATMSGDNIYWASGTPTVVQPIQNPELWMAEFGNYSNSLGGNRVSCFLNERNWDIYKNTDVYGDKVVGAIGTPTMEMMVASWNAKKAALPDSESYNVVIDFSSDERGYKLGESNGTYGQKVVISKEDNLYITGRSIWLAAPYSDGKGGVIQLSFMGNLIGIYAAESSTTGIRPVICLKASTPAHVNTSATGTDYILD